MPNRLAAETSPYLRQHADNPVDWYAWGPDALERARREDKPILLSIGYAACHWCHVMAHESFEDAETARLMNELYVNIKVDREERPDVDSVYMQAVQSMTGQGGWPMTMFLTPAGDPFYAGTYFPPVDHGGMPSFRRILVSVADAYRTKRARIDQTAAAMHDIYAAASAAAAATGRVGPTTLDRAYRSFVERYDTRYGGFLGAPKFPPAMSLEFALTYSARIGAAAALETAHGARTDAGAALDMVAHSFRQMARGGIYDQIGGGFHRYTVDEAWLVPHFEKMLYDNALIGLLGVHLWQATHDAEVRRVTEETLDWVIGTMTAPDGGFYASLDADSEGEEGIFYLWTEREMDALLGPDSALVKEYYGVTKAGNFEGRNILNVPVDPALVARRAGVTPTILAATVSRARQVLVRARAERVPPARDDKELAAWNGLMLRTMATAASAFGRADYTDRAVANAQFLRRELVRPGGRVMRTHTAGVTKIPGFLDDHAAVALGFLAVYELTFDRQWLDLAREIGQAIGTWFWDEKAETLFDTARDAETLITRPRDVTDNAVPSGTSLAIELWLRLAELFDETTMHKRAVQILNSLAEPMARHPGAFGHTLCAADMAVHGATGVAIVGDPGSEPFRELAAAVGDRFVPSLVMAGGFPDGAGSPSAGVAFLTDRTTVGGKATAYVCRNRVCGLPESGSSGLAAQLERASPLEGAPAEDG